MDEKQIKTTRATPLFPKDVNLKKYDYVTLFLDEAQISSDHRAHAFFSKEEVLYIRKKLWKAASAKNVLIQRVSMVKMR